MRTAHALSLILLVATLGLTAVAAGATALTPAFDEAAALGSSRLRPSQVGPGAIINVTTFDPNIAADGQCALIEAIVNANDDAATHADCPAGSGPDTIELPAGTYTLTLVNNVNAGGNGLPQVTSVITINGHGSTLTRSTAAGTPEFRIANVAPGGDLTLNDLTISNGRLLTISPAGGLRSWGTLTLNRCVVENNVTVGHGGGIAQGNGATLVLNDTIVRDNQASKGGGISSNESRVALNHSVVRGNTVAGGDADGGGIWLRVSSGYSGTLALDHTRVVSNTAANGTKPNGGGVAVIVQPGGTGVVTINDSTIAHNRAQYGGGAVMGVHGGTPAGSLAVTISRSTISNNLAADPAGGSALGGGIETYYATVTIANSTISGNSVADAYWSSGGGIWMGSSSGSQSSILNLVNTTVAGNSAVGEGGGITNYLSDTDASGMVYAVNSIVAGNTAVEGRDCMAADSGFASVGFTSLGHNIEGSYTCNFIDPTDQSHTDPLLGSLANNGGPTETHALLVGSPALGAASPTVCAADPVNAVDQRGVTRPQGAACDVGAYEVVEVPAALTRLDLQAQSGTVGSWGVWALVVGLVAVAASGVWRSLRRRQCAA